MALKPTIYKFKIGLSDFDRDYYDNLNLTLAQHPSETLERMMVRLLAFCLNADPDLIFTKGLSSVEEADVWLKTLDEQTKLWIDVGEPSFERVKKATRISDKVKVYSFNTKSDVWWKQSSAKLSSLKAEFFQFNFEQISELVQLIDRSVSLSCSISANSIFVSSDTADCQIDYKVLD